MNLKAALRSASLVLGTGYILYFFSERVFWSFLREGDAFAVLAGGWLVYSLFAYLLLAVVRLFRIGTVSGLVLAGAFFGWLGEGVYAMTLYGDPSMPFPLTIAWTGLAWHGPLSVVIGLFGLRRCLLAASLWPVAGAGAGIGAFWGFWASGWSQETPPVIAGAADFLLHAVFATLGLALAQRAIDLGDARRFAPSRTGLGLCGGLVLVFFAAITVPAIPWAPAVLLPLLALLYFALRRNAAGSGEDALAAIAGPVRLRNMAGLVIIPAAATGAYVILGIVGRDLPAHQIVAAIASLCGTAVLLVALAGHFRPRARQPRL